MRIDPESRAGKMLAAVRADRRAPAGPKKRPLSHMASERRMPSDLKPSRIPLTIVCGPPGGGKSTYVRENTKANDLVIDLDEIMRGLSGLPEHHTGAEWLSKALDRRNLALRSLATDTNHERAWFIISAPDPGERAEWQRQLGGKMIVCAPPLIECIKRINADPTRAGHRTRMLRAAREWWAKNKALEAVSA